jgi:hypothetical protein
MAKSDNPARAQAAASTRKLIAWAVEAVGKPLPEPVRRRAAIILSKLARNRQRSAVFPITSL